MTDRDLAARNQAEPDVAARPGRATTGEDDERVAQPGHLDPGSSADRTRAEWAAEAQAREERVRDDSAAAVVGDGPAATAVDEPTGTVAGEPVATVAGGPAATVVEEPATTEVRPRASGAAAFGALLAAIGLCGALTGLLAPEALVVAIMAGLLCVGALAGIARRPIAGRGVATLGLIVSLATIVIAVLAMTKQFSWPNSSVDEISRWHAWLVAHWSWLGRWA